MTAPLAQIAREIAYDVTSCTSAVQVQARTEAVLRRHWPAARGVVEVTGKSLMSVLNAEDLIVESAAEKNGLHDFYARLDRAAARLRARAVSAPVVVKRPVRTVTKLRTPAEEGVADSRSVNVEWSQIASMGVGLCLRNAGEVTAYINFVLRWCVPGQPWVERTEVQKPASWTEDTLPEIGRPFWFFTENERGSGEIRRNSDTPFDAGWFNAVDAIAWCYVTLPEVSHARP